MKKRALTILELLLVVSLIGLITGVLAYNMRGTLDRGRAFRTERAIERLRDLLLLALAEDNKTAEELAKDPASVVKPFTKNTKDLTHDGWKQEMKVTVVPGGRDFHITSEAWDRYKRNQRSQNKPSISSTAQEEGAGE